MLRLVFKIKARTQRPCSNIIGRKTRQKHGSSTTERSISRARNRTFSDFIDLETGTHRTFINFIDIDRKTGQILGSSNTRRNNNRTRYITYIMTGTNRTFINYTDLLTNDL
jgi:hypothetical protein